LGKNRPILKKGGGENIKRRTNVRDTGFSYVGEKRLEKGKRRSHERLEKMHGLKERAKGGRPADLDRNRQKNRWKGKKRAQKG